MYLKDKYKVSKAFLFLGFIPQYKSLYAFLRKAGYNVIFKPVLETKGNKHQIKGSVDAELVLHSMIEFSNYDKAIIVTGDGDFYCLVEYLIKKKKFARLIIPNQKRYSRLFLPFKPHIDYMNQLKKKLAKK